MTQKAYRLEIIQALVAPSGYIRPVNVISLEKRHLHRVDRYRSRNLEISSCKILLLAVGIEVDGHGFVSRDARCSNIDKQFSLHPPILNSESGISLSSSGGTRS